MPNSLFIIGTRHWCQKSTGYTYFQRRWKKILSNFTKFGSNASDFDTKRQFAKTKSFIMGVVDFLFGDYDYKELCLCSLPCSKSRAPMRFYAKDEPLPFVLAMIMGLQHACVFHCWFAICMVHFHSHPISFIFSFTRQFRHDWRIDYSTSRCDEIQRSFHWRWVAPVCHFRCFDYFWYLYHYQRYAD